MPMKVCLYDMLLHSSANLLSCKVWLMALLGILTNQSLHLHIERATS